MSVPTPPGRVHLMRGVENVWSFIVAQTLDEHVSQKVIDMIDAVHQQWVREERKNWGGFLDLSRSRNTSLTDGRIVDCYCLEYVTFEQSPDGPETEDAMRARLTQYEIHPCFLMLDANRKIVEYFNAERGS